MEILKTQTLALKLRPIFVLRGIKESSHSFNREISKSCLKADAQENKEIGPKTEYYF